MGDTPDVSIVILTKNGGPAFRSTLRQIYSQQTTHEFEVIVVDSGSKDETLDILNEFPVRTFAIQPQEFNFGLTRNYGFSLSRGEYIVTISQDAIPSDPFWLENLIRPLVMNPNVVAVQGNQTAAANAPAFYWLKRGSFYFTSDARRWVQLYGHGLSFVNCAIRKAFWQTHPIRFTPFSEDRLFQKEIHNSRREVAIANAALCFHAHQYTCRSLVTRLLGEGIGWKYAGMEYSLRDCVLDIIRNKWMLREAFSALRRREIRSLHEVLFLFLRPICVFWGNRRKVEVRVKEGYP